MAPKQGKRVVNPHGGLRAHLAGEAAEGQVARHYQARGISIESRRWRGSGGEIDLVARDAGGLIFVEVKRSRTHARAAERVGYRQIERLFNAASEYLAACGLGLNTQVRFDVALVDGMGRIDILENALSA